METTRCTFPGCQLRFEPECVGIRDDDGSFFTGWFMPDAVTGADREVSDNLPAHDHTTMKPAGPRIFGRGYAPGSAWR